MHFAIDFLLCCYDAFQVGVCRMHFSFWFGFCGSDEGEAKLSWIIA